MFHKQAIKAIFITGGNWKKSKPQHVSNSWGTAEILEGKKKKNHNILRAGVFIEFKNKCQEMERDHLRGTKLDSWVATAVQRRGWRLLHVTLAMNRAMTCGYLLVCKASQDSNSQVIIEEKEKLPTCL